MSRFSRLAVVVSLVTVLVGLIGAQAFADSVEQQKLTASIPDFEDHFGRAVSVNGDRVAVGAPGHNCTAGFGCGAVTVYQFDGTSWVEEQLLVSPAAGKQIGTSVSLERNNLLAGGYIGGEAYIYWYNGFSWERRWTVAASDYEFNDSFGFAVSLNGDVAVVSSPKDDCTDGADCGSVYVFRFQGFNWVLQQKLTASDSAADDQFGTSVSVSGNTILIGAKYDDCVDGIYCGAAYVYKFDGTSWIETQKLTALNAGGFDNYGASVSMRGDLAVIGARGSSCEDESIMGNSSCGAAYVYRFDGNVWIQEQKLSANTNRYLQLGFSVSVSSDAILVGAIGSLCSTGVSCGSAYKYLNVGNSWVNVQRMIASDVASYDTLGYSVFFDGDAIVLGAHNDDCSEGNNCGSAYTYTCDGNTASPLAATGIDRVTKDRYLTVNPNNSPGELTALRVTRVGSSTSWYVGCSLQDAGADGMLANLVPTAEFCEWTTSAIHIRGCEIVPGNEYLVEAAGCDAIFTASLQLFTTAPQIAASRSYGDLVGAFENGAWKAAEGFVTANDIVAVVQKFQLLSIAPHISRVDNDGQTPNGLIASNDILREVQAFAGSDFGYGVTGCLTGTCVPNCP